MLGTMSTADVSQEGNWDILIDKNWLWNGSYKNLEEIGKKSVEYRYLVVPY